MLAANQVLHQGRYRIIAANGSDEVGGWYEAYDTVDGTSVTLRERLGRVSKVITANQLAAINAEFANGAKALSAIRHESLISVCDYFSDVDRQYLVLESVDGEELTRFTGEARPPVSHVMAWADQLLNALDNLHRQNPPIIHQDIRPSNIKITANYRAKLVAGGVPVMPASDTVTFIPGQTAANPSFNYKPLEQLWGGLDPASQRVILNSYDERSAGILLRSLDARSDLYSLAAMLYHVLTGVAPIDALERSIAMLEGKADPLQNVQELNSDVHFEISNVFGRAMSVRRENRFDSALEMLQALRSGTMRAEASVQPIDVTKTAVAEPDDVVSELDELAAEQVRLEEETRRLEARRAELETERARREEETRHAEEERLAQEAEAERQSAEQKLAELEAERERERAEEQRLAREAEAERLRAEERVCELEVERERHHEEQVRLEAEAKLELERSQKKIEAISSASIQINKEDDVLSVFAPGPLSSEVETHVAGERANDVILADYAEKSGSKRGVMAAVAGVVLAAVSVAVWQLMPTSTAVEPSPVSTAAIAIETPQPTVEPTPVAEAVVAEAETESTTTAPVETGGAVRPRPQISAVSDKQKRATPVVARPAAAKKKLTVDDLLNDN